MSTKISNGNNLNYFPPGRNLVWLTMAAMVLAGRFIPTPWTWGFNHLNYLPNGLFWSLSSVAIFLMIFSATSGAQTLLGTILPQFFFASRKNIFLISAALGTAFYIFRQAAFFMGDGYLITDQISSGVSLRPFDNLDYLGHFYCFKLVGKSLGLAPYHLYQGSSILAGTVTCGLSLVLINRFNWEPWRKAATFILLFTSGPVALFFGYVESYSLLGSFLLIFVLLGLLALDGKEPIWKAALCFSLALCCHLSAILFFPGYVFLITKMPGKKLPHTLSLLVSPLVFALLPATMFFYFSEISFTQVVIALRGTGHSQGIFHSLTGDLGLFHWRGLANLGNLAMITAPASIVLLLFNLPVVRTDFGNVRLRFLGILVVTVAVFSLLVDRKLGAARDWDLLAAHYSALVLLATFVAGKNVPSVKHGPVPRQIIFGISVSIILVIPWILLQNSETGSAQKFFETSSIAPPHAQAYAYETLGTYYRNSGNLDEAIAYYEFSVEANPRNARLHMILGTAYTRQAAESSERISCLSRAEKHFHAAWEISPTLSEAGYNLGRNLLQQKKYAEALAALTTVSTQIPHRADVWSALGWAQFNLELFDAAGVSARKALEIDPEADAKSYYH